MPLLLANATATGASPTLNVDASRILQECEASKRSGTQIREMSQRLDERIPRHQSSEGDWKLIQVVLHQFSQPGFVSIIFIFHAYTHATYLRGFRWG